MTPVPRRVSSNGHNRLPRVGWRSALRFGVGLALLLVLALLNWREERLVLVGAALLALLWLWLLREFVMSQGRQAQLLQRLEQAQRLAVLGIWRRRIDDDTVDWDAQSARMYGFPEGTSSVPVAEIMRRIHPDDVAALQRRMSIASEDPHDLVNVPFQHRIVRDGAVRWIETRIETASEDGIGILSGIQQDITQQVADRERLRQAQDLARIGDWEWDVARGTIRWSQTMYDIYGVSPDTFRPDADNAFARIHPDDRARIQALGQDLAEHGEPCRAEFRIVRDDGSVRVLSMRSMREITADGRVVIRSVQQDITELAQAREDAQRAEEHYRLLFNRNPMPMWVFDPASLRFLAVNDAMLRDYGYDRAQLLEMTILDIRPKAERAQVEQIARGHEDERPQGHVWTHMHRDGTLRRMCIHTTDFDFQGRPGRLVTAQDVTEREAREKRFQLLARATSDAIYDLDIGRDALWWGDSFYAVFGYSREQIPPTLQAWAALVHPDDLARVDASLAAAIEDPAAYEWEEEYRFLRHDGTHATVVDRGFFVRDGAGVALRMVGGMFDFTEKRRQDADLRLLRRAVEATESGILIADVRDPLIPAVYVNQGFQDMTGYGAEEILGRDSRLLDFDPRDVDKVRHIRRAVAERRELRTLVRMRRKDGSAFWNDFYMAPVLDEAGAITHMMSVSLDVTERQRSEERFQLVARATSDAIWDWDLVKDVTWRSDNVYPLFGYEAGEIRGSMTDWSQLLHPDDRARVETSIRSAIESDAEGWECEYRLRRKDGVYADVLDRGFLLRNEEGKAVRAVGGIIDVTQKHRDQADLRLLRRAVESTDNGISIADARQPDWPLVYVNAAFEQMTGYPACEVLGRNCRFLQGADQDQAAIETIRLAITEQREARVVLRNYRKDGTLFWNELHLAAVHDDNGVSHYVGIQNDVSHRHLYEQELAHRATHDQLTGLPNRHLIMDRLQQAILNADRYGRHAGVVFIDLDDFKLINDNLDHAAGDEALRIVASRLRTLVRDTDTVGRLGGDEFVVVLTEQTDEAGVAQVIARVSTGLSAPMEIGGVAHTLTPSIGWARYPDDGGDAVTLLKRADVAMYQAKRGGRNRSERYRADLDRHVAQRVQLVAQLRAALEREEFRLAFQPMYDAAGRPRALEALVRWQHPVRGLLLPGEFIGVCEESGLILELGRRILREAARHHSLLAAHGFSDVRIAVNVSAMQFGPAFERDVAAVLAEFSLPPHILELEITESVVMQHPETGIKTMGRIADLGVCIAIDDFGTGYSSLAYLQRLPLHRLKIDRSFVRDLPHDREATSICSMILQLARSLELCTVGEGVETAGQLEWLRANGCDEVQGYLLARPAPFDEILAKLARSGTTPPA